jgi:hypothetical protein
MTVKNELIAWDMYCGRDLHTSYIPVKLLYTFTTVHGVTSLSYPEDGRWRQHIPLKRQLTLPV